MDPPPVVQLAVHDEDPYKHWLHDPQMFLNAELYRVEGEALAPINIGGSSVVSLSAIKKPKPEKGGMYFPVHEIMGCS
jgi:hypothetical protein